MKKSRCRTQKRLVTRRASTVSKSRCIHGLPCSLPVASWTLILLLLLTSSFSHVHETEDRGDAGVGLHEDYLESSEGKKLILGGEVGSLVDRSSTQLIEDSNHDRRETGPESNYSPASEAAKTGVVPDRLEQEQGIHSSLASPLDALQYAEYGAGLLQKSGAGEEGPGADIVDNSGGMHCPGLIDPNAALECVESFWNLPCRNEFLAGKDGQILDRAQCSSCESGVGAKSCPYDRSLLDVFLHSSCAQKVAVEPERKITSDSVGGMLSYEADFEGSTNPSSQTEVLETADILTHTPPSSDDSQLDSITLQEGEVVTKNNRIDVEDPVNAMPEKGGVSEVGQDNHVSKPPTDFDVHDDPEKNKGKDTVLPSTEIYAETSVDGKMPEESRLSANSHGDLGVLQAGVDDVLIEELESLTKTEGEDLSSVKPRTSGGIETKDHLEPAELRRVGEVMSLDEYKRSILEKQKLGKVVNLSTLQTPKTRQSDESYNYAASSHGAKVLSANKEAKGAGHIINSDKDKYLRNPCSAEDKFVVLELSEETFVDTIVIANFEFHSANVKDLEVYGSPAYPTKEWILLGKFHAENVRHRQKFPIEDPRLVRYVMLKMLSHWGSEFFCTLSAVEVFGVDVIKNLLDDWIASEEGENSARAQLTGSVVHHEETASDSAHSSATVSEGDVPEFLGAQSYAEASISPDSPGVISREKKVDAKDEDSRAGDSFPEVHHIPGGKPPGDSVLKILMQKVKALELNQSLFDNYLEDTNINYKAMLSELDKDLSLLSERLRNETAMSASLAIRILEMERKMKEENAYLDFQLSIIASNFTENVEFLRWQIQSMERREITAIILALFSPILSALLHVLARCMPNRRASSVQEYMLQTEGIAEKMNSQLDARSLHSFCELSSSVVLYLACGLIVLVLSV